MMTDADHDIVSLESRLNEKFRGHDTRDWDAWRGLWTANAQDVPIDAQRAWVSRVKASHRGIGQRQHLTHVIAGAANQAFLEEICAIEGLERLELEDPVTATNLAPLAKLTRLGHLSIDSPRAIADFSPLIDLPSLRTLLITNAKHMVDIGWLRDAHHLEVIGIEGGMWSPQTIASLAPLNELTSLRAFLATSTRLGDTDLSPLATCPKLEFLGCAQFAPRAAFERLHTQRPDLVCDWFRPEMWRALAR